MSYRGFLSVKVSQCLYFRGFPYGGNGYWLLTTKAIHPPPPISPWSTVVLSLKTSNRLFKLVCYACVTNVYCILMASVSAIYTHKPHLLQLGSTHTPTHYLRETGAGELLQGRDVGCGPSLQNVITLPANGILDAEAT